MGEPMDAYHEMDDHGNHRITVDGHTSYWVHYRSFPTVEVNGIQYIAASAYWQGTLPIESVLKVELVSRESRVYPGQGENPGRNNLEDSPGYSVG